MLATLLLAVPVAVENIGQSVFFSRVPIPYSTGMPASATVLMGIHSGTYYGPGGFDGSSWNLFWDTTAANAAAVKGIGEYWNTYLHNPKEVKFFLQKTAWQWLDPWFEALTMFGENSINDNHFARFFKRNMEAMDAFFARKTGEEGLSLSQKVWRYRSEEHTSELQSRI